MVVCVGWNLRPITGHKEIGETNISNYLPIFAEPNAHVGGSLILMIKYYSLRNEKMH